MFDQLKGKPSYSSPRLGLYPAHYARIQPIKSPLFILMNQQERDEFRRKAAASHHEPASNQEKQAEQQNSQTLTALFNQNPALKKGVLWHIPDKTFEQSKVQSPSSSKATSGCTTPGEKDEREITDYIMRMPPAQFMSFLNKHLSPAPSTASADSFVHLSSKASSSNGDHFEVRSLPDSMAASPRHSKAASPLISRAPSHLRLTLPTVAEQPHQQHAPETTESLDAESSDSDKDTVEQSTATLKP